MTKEEIIEMANQVKLPHDYVRGEPMWLDKLEQFAKLITEKALETKDEPVAWMTINAYGDEDDVWYENPEGKLLEGWTYKPLYTTPQPKQEQGEPVEYWNAVEGWVKIDEVREHFESVSCGTIYKNGGEGRVPLYATPQQRKPLTRDEVEKLFWEWKDRSGYSIALFEFRNICNAIEAKLKEKNNAV